MHGCYMFITVHSGNAWTFHIDYHKFMPLLANELSALYTHTPVQIDLLASIRGLISKSGPWSFVWIGVFVVSGTRGCTADSLYKTLFVIVADEVSTSTWIIALDITSNFQRHVWHTHGYTWMFLVHHDDWLSTVDVDHLFSKGYQKVSAPRF